MSSENFSKIFFGVINDYHKKNKIDQTYPNPIATHNLENLLYQKCWIDNVQWHQEDLIRDPNIDPKKGMELKRGIDENNQLRTNIVEKLEDFFAEKFQHIKPKKNAILNTESLGWAIDRLSILCLKIFHMKEETLRVKVSLQHIAQCSKKLEVLELQKSDLIQAINTLIENTKAGKVIFKVYRQMKMYNDENLNPVLYNHSQGE